MAISIILSSGSAVVILCNHIPGAEIIRVSRLSYLPQAFISSYPRPQISGIVKIFTATHKIVISLREGNKKEIVKALEGLDRENLGIEDTIKQVLKLL